jgi:glutamate decarboxylase
MTIIKIKDCPPKGCDVEELMITSYGSHDFSKPIPKYKIPDDGMQARHAKNLVHDMLMLDGNSRLNLATFVTTFMEPEARELMAETLDKNMIDKDEYPQTAEMEMRCVNMIARLWNCPESQNTIGCSTTGSSEACMLGGMAMKWHWRDRMRAKGKATDKPNLVMGINVQVCWDKFCRYWDIEMRQAPMLTGKYVLTAEEAVNLCDENTIGIVGILGTTFTGEYEDIEAINDAVDKLNKKTGWEIPIHVDAASGGFVAPFLEPKLKWDFRLKWVKSINASGHKYGLVYPGVGWAVWRDKEELPKDLIFYVNYLGGEMPTFAINFSRPGSQIILQYYNFLRLGFEGYRRVLQNCRDVALHLSSSISKMEVFELVSNGSDIPAFCWKLKTPMNFTLFDLSEHLRYNGWQIPAYTLPENVTDITVMRIVVKVGFTLELANMLLDNLKSALQHFAKQPKKKKKMAKHDMREKTGFHH